MILSHADCFIQGEVIGFQVLLDSLYPHSTRASWWYPLLQKGKLLGSFCDLYCLAFTQRGPGVSVPSLLYPYWASQHWTNWGELIVLCTRTISVGHRRFTLSAAVIFSSLPLHLRSSSISRRQFSDGLKTNLFKQAYGVEIQLVLMCANCVSLTQCSMLSFLCQLC